MHLGCMNFIQQKDENQQKMLFNLYRGHTMYAALRNVPSGELTLCTNEKFWILLLSCCCNNNNQQQWIGDQNGQINFGSENY